MPPCCTAVASVLQQLKCWHTVRVSWGLMCITTVAAMVDHGHVRNRVMPTWRLDWMAISRNCWNHTQHCASSFQFMRGVVYLNTYNMRCVAPWHMRTSSLDFVVIHGWIWWWLTVCHSCTTSSTWCTDSWASLPGRWPPNRSWWTMSVSLVEYEAMLTQQSMCWPTAGSWRTGLMLPSSTTNSQYSTTPGTTLPTGTWPGSYSDMTGDLSYHQCYISHINYSSYSFCFLVCVELTLQIPVIHFFNIWLLLYVIVHAFFSRFFSFLFNMLTSRLYNLCMINTLFVFKRKYFKWLDIRFSDPVNLRYKCSLSSLKSGYKFFFREKHF